jgi:hypothetical protein
MSVLRLEEFEKATVNNLFTFLFNGSKLDLFLIIFLYLIFPSAHFIYNFICTKPYYI